MPRVPVAFMMFAACSPPAPHEFASCDGLTTMCGPSSNKNCCATAEVTGGTFARSYDAATDLHDDPGSPASVSTFRLDTYEVTVGRFRTFVTKGPATQANAPASGAGTHGDIDGSGWRASWNSSLAANTTDLTAALACNATFQTWTNRAGANENQPINCVTWYEAFAFCAWDGGYLPSEAEWNYAAAGGDEQRAYPWSTPASSTTVDCSYANYRINTPPGTYCVNGTTGAANRVGSESPTGDGKWGQSDLAGNVTEWVLDAYAAPYANPCEDCANLADGNRVLRGGAFGFPAASARTADRLNDAPTRRSPSVGFRCARPAL